VICVDGIKIKKVVSDIKIPFWAMLGYRKNAYDEVAVFGEDAVYQSHASIII